MQDYQRNDSKSLLFELDHLTILELQGTAARDVLQGQLTCDVREVDETHMRQGALCNLKGRVLALIDVIQLENIHLILPRDLSAIVTKNLQKAAMLSRVTIQESSSFTLFGFYQTTANLNTPFNWLMPQHRYEFYKYAEGFCYGLSENLSVLVTEREYANSLREIFKATQSLSDSGAWHALCLQAGLLEIYPSTSGLFLPHRINLHHTGQLNFNKGCYRGQEIIARMHYRSTLKHTLKQFKLNSTETLQPGLKIIDPENNQELGELIDFYKISPDTYAITASILFEHPTKVQFSGHQNCCILH